MSVHDPEEDTPPEEKPRYLLPEGCKDLSDALKSQQQSPVPEEAPLPEEEATQLFLSEIPVSITVPYPVILRDLAAALHVKPFMVVHLLMRQNTFATLQTPLDFATVSALCSLLRVVAHKAI